MKLTEHDARFAHEWKKAVLAGKSVADVAAKIGLAVGSASNYAARLRRQGTPLPKFRRGPTPRALR